MKIQAVVPLLLSVTIPPIFEGQKEGDVQLFYFIIGLQWTNLLSSNLL